MIFGLDIKIEVTAIILKRKLCPVSYFIWCVQSITFSKCPEMWWTPLTARVVCVFSILINHICYTVSKPYLSIIIIFTLNIHLYDHTPNMCTRGSDTMPTLFPACVNVVWKSRWCWVSHRQLRDRNTRRPRGPMDFPKDAHWTWKSLYLYLTMGADCSNWTSTISCIYYCCFMMRAKWSYAAKLAEVQVSGLKMKRTNVADHPQHGRNMMLVLKWKNIRTTRDLIHASNFQHQLMKCRCPQGEMHLNGLALLFLRRKQRPCSSSVKVRGPIMQDTWVSLRWPLWNRYIGPQRRDGKGVHSRPLGPSCRGKIRIQTLNFDMSVGLCRQSQHHQH